MCVFLFKATPKEQVNQQNLCYFTNVEKRKKCNLGGNSVINQEKASIVGGERTEALLMRYWLHLQDRGCFLSFKFLQVSNHREKILTLHWYLLKNIFLITGRLNYLIMQQASFFILSPGSEEQLLFCCSNSADGKIIIVML